VYDRAFTLPPTTDRVRAGLILTSILLLITIGYVRASVQQGRSNEAQSRRGPRAGLNVLGVLVALVTLFPICDGVTAFIAR